MSRTPRALPACALSFFWVIYILVGLEGEREARDSWSCVYVWVCVCVHGLSIQDPHEAESTLQPCLYFGLIEANEGHSAALA